MAKQVSSLSVALFASVAPFASGLKAGERSAASFLDKVTGVGSKLLELTGIAGLVGTALGGVFEVGKGFDLAGQFETAQVQLTALAGSANTAGNVLGQLREFAATSPFAFPDLDDAAKRLLAVGVNAGAVSPLLHMIGDVAAGVGHPIGEIADLFTRVASEGSLGSRELREFARSGIPLTQTLAQQFHTNAAGVEQMAEAGRIGFTQLAQAFQSLTGPAGRFGGILAAQAGTIDGVLHGLSATVEETLADVAEQLIAGLNLRPAIAGLSGELGSLRPVLTGWVASVLPSVRSVAASLYGSFTGLYVRVVPIFDAVAAGVRAAWGPVSAFVEQHARAIETAFTAIGGALAAAAIPTVLGTIGTAIGFIGGLISPVLVPIGSALLAIATPVGLVGAAVAILAVRFDLVGRAGQAFGAVAAWVSANWQAMAVAVANVAVSLFGAVAGAFTAIATVSAAVWSGVVDVVGWAWGAMGGQTAVGGASVAGVMGTVGSVAGWMADKVSTAFDTVGYAFTHLGDVADLIGVSVELGLVTVANQIQYAFGTVAPTVLSWFANNWRDVLWDVLQFTGHVFQNIETNVFEVFANLPGLIAGTTDWSKIWTPLTDGFEATAKALPAIAARVPDALEQSLTAKRASLSDALGTGLGDAIAKRQKDAANAAKAFTTALTSTKPPELPKPVLPKPDPFPPFDVKTALDPSALTLAVTPEVHHAKIIHSGSAESLAARFAPVTRVVGAVAAGILPLATPAQAAPAPQAPPAIVTPVTPPVASTTPPVPKPWPVDAKAHPSIAAPVTASVAPPVIVPRPPRPPTPASSPVVAPVTVRVVAPTAPPVNVRRPPAVPISPAPVAIVTPGPAAHTPSPTASPTALNFSPPPASASPIATPFVPPVTAFTPVPQPSPPAAAPGMIAPKPPVDPNALDAAAKVAQSQFDRAMVAYAAVPKGREHWAESDAAGDRVDVAMAAASAARKAALDARRGSTPPTVTIARPVTASPRLDAPVAVAPITATIPAADGSAGSANGAAASAENWRQANYYLDRIETNTRPLQLQAQPITVSI